MDEGKRAPEPQIVRSHLNSYHYFYQDATTLHELARSRAGTFEEVRFCRTAVLLYIFSLEGLINRALEEFLPGNLKEYFLEREDRLSIADKWLLVPLIGGSGTFERGGYPWNCFTDLITLRNDFIHPKHDRYAYYRWLPDRSAIDSLVWADVPEDSGIRGRDLSYGQIDVPKDPHSLQTVHADRVKRVVDDMVKELNRLLSGQVDEAFLHNENLRPVYPPGAQFNVEDRERASPA
jgi:hypothetical protein